MISLRQLGGRLWCAVTRRHTWQRLTVVAPVIGHPNDTDTYRQRCTTCGATNPNPNRRSHQ